MKVLLADDERTITVPLRDDLIDAGHDVTVVDRGDTAVEKLAADHYDVLITDINMPGVRGDELLVKATELRPGIAVVIVTGFGTVQSAVQAMKNGAADYVLKPFVNEQIVLLLARIAHLNDLEAENRNLRHQITDLTGFEHVVGSSEQMQQVFRTIRTVAPSDSTVLIMGETGTGKEIFARALHNLSGRSSGPLVAISCAAIPSTLLEDELFGHEKGAFTDARERKLGRIERSNGGTFFLDDIDDMPLATQVKLLRVLQEREVERLGGDRVLHVNIRVVAATKVDLRSMVRDGRFREDLFYRLNVVPIRLPPLRERVGDVPLLVRHFMRKFSHGESYVVKADVMAMLERHHWPGNVRELEHSVERAIAMSGPEHVLRREHMLDKDPLHPHSTPAPTNIDSLKVVLERAERDAVVRALNLCDSKSQAADALGISRKSLWDKLRLHSIEDSKP